MIGPFEESVMTAHSRTWKNALLALRWDELYNDPHGVGVGSDLCLLCIYCEVLRKTKTTRETFASNIPQKKCEVECSSKLHTDANDCRLVRRIEKKTCRAQWF